MVEIFVTFMGFILAFFALVNRIISFRLNTGVISLKALQWLLIALGLISVLHILINQESPFTHKFLNLYIPEIIKYGVSLKKHQIIFARIPYDKIGICIYTVWNAGLVSIVLYLFYKLITPVKFRKNNAGRYFIECAEIIATGIDKEINSLTTEILNSIPVIFESASKDRNSKTKEYAIALIGLFSDERFCKNIVRHNPSTLQKLFEVVINSWNRNKITDKNLLSSLIFLLLTDPDSQLRREEPYSGLGYLKSFQKLIFGDIRFLNNARPLSLLSASEAMMFDQESIKKFFEVLKFSLEKYLEEKDENEKSRFSDTLYAALMFVKKIIESSVEKLNNDKSQSEKNLLCCATSLHSLMEFINAKENLFPDATQIDKEKYSYHTDKSIYGALASGIYEAIETLSRDRSQYDNIRYILSEIYPLFDSQRSKPLKAIQERLDVLLEEKIRDNLTNLRYPAVTASLIVAFDLCEPQNAKFLIHKYLMTSLKKSFLKAYSCDAEKARDMIPSDTECDIDSKKLIRKHHIRWKLRKETEELVLE